MATKAQEATTVAIPKLGTKTLINLARWIHSDLIDRYAQEPAWEATVIYIIPAGSIRSTDQQAAIWVQGISKGTLAAISQKEDRGRLIQKLHLEDYERGYHLAIDDLRHVIDNELMLTRAVADRNAHNS
ncbi:hypothetical protein ACTXIU_13075 [Glutamicibacter arilaitensis]|uniref:hypothetical protein n=1 Tax=Glutamicibacter arilaitensis TaxID=256701 RepID=UPI003FD1CAA3